MSLKIVKKAPDSNYPNFEKNNHKNKNDWKKILDKIDSNHEKIWSALVEKDSLKNKNKNTFEKK